ncbi:MAG: DUF1553 domain-containing protein [Planctomycetota bacterium]
MDRSVSLVARSPLAWLPSAWVSWLWVTSVWVWGSVAPLAAQDTADAAPERASVTTAAHAAADGPNRVDFNRDIRPILSDRCFKCHGFDEKGRKAGLRLDTYEGLTRVRDGVRPVVPGDAEASEMVRRIESHDPKQVMPPPSAGVTLNDAERGVLRRWVEAGAPFARHWAYVPPPERAVPPGAPHPVDAFVRAELGRHGLAPQAEADRATLIRRVSLDLVGLPPTPEEIDAFVADPAADAYERLVDRLLASPHFGERVALVWLDAARYADTNGFHHDNVRTAWPYRDWVVSALNDNLPYDRFVTEQLAGDLLPDATVDQRLASAFCRMHNINDEGGALDPEYRVEAVCDRIETIATTFMALTFTCCRCHDHKYDPFTQDDYYSLYALFGSVDERGVYPASFEQARAYPPRLMYRDAQLAKRTEAAGSVLEAARAELAAAAPQVEGEAEAFGDYVRRKLGIRWVDSRLRVARAASGGDLEILPDGSARAHDNAEFETHTFELDTDAGDLGLLRIEALPDPACGKGSVGLAEHGNAVISTIRVEALPRGGDATAVPVVWAWAWADHEQPNSDHGIANVLSENELGWALDGHNRAEARTGILIAERPFGFDGGTTVRVTVEYRSRYPNHVVGRLRLSLAQADPFEAARRDLLAEFPTEASDWFLAGPFTAKSFAAAFDGVFGPERDDRLNADAAFGKVRWKHMPAFRDGAAHELKGARAAFYLGRRLRSPLPRTVRAYFGSDDGLRVYLNGQEVLRRRVQRGVRVDDDVAELQLRAGDNFLLLKVVNDGGPAGFAFRYDDGEAPCRQAPWALVPATRRDAASSTAFHDDFGRRRSPTYRRLSQRLEEARLAKEAVDAEATPVIVMQELPQPKATFVLARGRYDMADEARPVDRRPPMELGGALPAGAPHDRLGFARWLTAPDHPLTARVHVNRLWQMLFGTGIVKSVENFGYQSEWPSHPELLDWLARWFVQSGWDQKALLRLLVTSATYRQSSARTAESAAADPDDRLLSWFPRRRLLGELVRDQALFVSGLLVDKIGGPSVKPYQPDHLWAEVSIGQSSNTGAFVRDDGDALYRRSLYTFWKRTSPNPQMATFDAPTREFCVVRRETTNTPLQALVLWNDAQFLEAARMLAARTLREATGDEARVRRMFRRCTGRTPGPREQTVLLGLLHDLRVRYAAAPRDAASLLSIGDAELAGDLDPVEVAAFTMVASATLGLDETLVRD